MTEELLPIERNMKDCVTLRYDISGRIYRSEATDMAETDDMFNAPGNDISEFLGDKGNFLDTVSFYKFDATPEQRSRGANYLFMRTAKKPRGITPAVELVYMAFPSEELAGRMRDAEYMTFGDEAVVPENIGHEEIRVMLTNQAYRRIWQEIFATKRGEKSRLFDAPEYRDGTKKPEDAVIMGPMFDDRTLMFRVEDGKLTCPGLENATAVMLLGGETAKKALKMYSGTFDDGGYDAKDLVYLVAAITSFINSSYNKLIDNEPLDKSPLDGITDDEIERGMAEFEGLSDEEIMKKMDEDIEDYFRPDEE